jgi:hypothetical protein
VAALLLGTALPALAQGGKAVPKGNKAASAAAEVRVQSLVAASEAEVRIIREYYVAKGLKPKPLPPGIARNLARGKPVPPGLMRVRVPDDLLAQLPPREGYQWAVANNVVLLVDTRGFVHDILRQIF